MSSEQLCKVCKMAPVDGCPNTLEYPAGAAIMRYDGDDLVSDVCPNMKVVALRQRLLRIDPQFAEVKHEPATPLYRRGDYDLTQKNVLLAQTDWRTFLSHFKWVIAVKDPRFFVRIVTDQTLKQVYMGEASARSRLPTQREDGELPIFNSLEDLLALPDLVILRVGFVVYFNRAMASIFREALLLREGLGKPTWIVEQPGQERFEPWRKSDHGVVSGMPCCDDDVYALVNARYLTLQLGAHESSLAEHEDGVSVGRSVDVTIPAPPGPPEDGATEQEEEEPVEEAAGSTAVDPDEPIIESLTRHNKRRGYQKPRRRSGL